MRVVTLVRHRVATRTLDGLNGVSSRLLYSGASRKNADIMVNVAHEDELMFPGKYVEEGEDEEAVMS